MRWIKRLATIVVVLFIAIPAIAYLLLSTSAGSSFVLAQAVKFSPVAVSYDNVSGALIDELTFSNLSIETETQTYSAEKLYLNWHPFELLDKKLTIEKLAVTRPKVLITSASSANDEPFQFPQITLPVTVDVAEFKVTDFAFQPTPESSSLATYPMQLVSRVRFADRQLRLNNVVLQAEQPQFTVHHEGQLAIRLSDNYPLELTGDYTINFADQRIQAIAGRMDVSGALRRVPIQIETTFQAPTTPPQTLTAEVASPLTNLSWQADLTLNELPLKLATPWLESYATLRDSYIKEGSSVSGLITVDRDAIEIEQLTFAELGQPTGRLVVDGQWRHDNFRTTYEQSPFDLRLDYTDLSYQSEAISVEAFSGTSSVKGTLADYQFVHQSTLDLRSATERLIDNLAAEINGRGSLNMVNIAKLNLTSEQLELMGQLNANWQEQLALDLQIASGRSSIGLDGNKKAVLQGDLSLRDNELNLTDFVISLDTTELTLNGSTAKNNLLGKLVINDLQQLSNLPNGLSELQALQTEFSIDTQQQLQEFELLIKTLQLQTASLDSWLLTKPTRFRLQRGEQTWTGSLDKLCLQHDANQFGVLCVGLDLTPKTIIASLTGERLSLWLLNRFRERDVAQRIAGLVTLDASATLDRESTLIRDVALQLSSDNTIFFALNQTTSTRLSYWELSAHGNAEAISAEVEGQLANNEGGLFGDLAILDLYGSRQVEGSLLFSLDDLAMLDWVLPGMRYHGGKATAQLNLTGTMSEPSLSGDMEVYAESVVFAETNFVFNEVRLALIDRPNSDGALEIEGQAQAGENGWLLVEGVAMPLEAEAYLRISGQNFRALQMPTATVDISPDLTLYVNERAIEIAGTVDVPYAAIAAPDFETSVSNSNDVIITRNGERVTEEMTKEDGMAVNAQVRVNLGKQVTVDAYGFTGRLQGSLEVLEEPRRPTTAIGSINVAEGSYELYGQELTIDRGAFIYNGGDISNPGLDLRVKRDLASSTNLRNVSVGAQVVGTLTEPDFQLFSTPAMPDSEILSYLILGKSMQSASSTSSDDIQLQALLMLGAKGTDAIGESLQDTFGIDEFGIDNDPNTRETSFYIGKYLSPRLFVRYGVGLLESTNTFMVRYQLTERLLIETMASSQSQGGDIFYTFER